MSESVFIPTCWPRARWFQYRWWLMLWRRRMRYELQLLRHGHVLFHVRSRSGWFLYQDDIWRAPFTFCRLLVGSFR